MKAQNVSLQEALTVGENGGKSILSVVEAKVLQILASNTIGIHLKAQAMPESGFVNGGTVFFRKPNILKVTAYDATGAKKQTPAVDRVAILLNTAQEIQYEIESLDIKRYFQTMTGESIANAIVSGWAQGATLAIAAFLDLVYMSTAIKAATAQSNVYTLPSITADISSVTTRDKAFSEGVGTITTAYTKILKTINTTSIGVNRSEIYGIIDLPFKNVLIGGTGAYGSDQTQRNMTDNTLGTNEKGDGTSKIGDIDFYTSALLNQTPAAFANFVDGNTTGGFDTTNIAAIIVHREAIGLPMTPIVSDVAINPNNGNPVFIHKFVYGADSVRPELTAVIKYFVKTPSN